MTAILGWSRTMETRTLDDVTTRKAVASIRRNAELQAHLIEDVLDVSRIITGNIVLNREPCSPGDIVRESVEEFRPAAEGKRLELDLTVDVAVGPLLADPQRLRQIVSNLLSNAVKFTPSGGRIDVTAVADDGKVEIAVADTGPGIAPEELEAIFEEFKQATDGKRAEGTGLGLPLSRKLVELHGGRLWVESEVDRGSTFRFTLPAGQGA
jgi:signal transduction histidine kinase